MTLIDQYEQGSIMEKENACAVAAAVAQAQQDGRQVSEVALISRTHPLWNLSLTIQSPRWFVRILDDGKALLYRVWRSGDTWQAVYVRPQA